MMHDQPLRYIVIADPESLRWKAFERELQLFQNETGAHVEAEVVSWIDLIHADGDLSSLKNPPCVDRTALVRVESPARSFEVIRALLIAGSHEDNCFEPSQWIDVEYEKGKLVEPGLVYVGLKRVLSRFALSVANFEPFQLLANPLHVLWMFDKNETSRRLLDAGISTPEILNVGRQYSDSVSALSVEMQKRQWPTAYVKLASGSSASGIIKVDINQDSLIGLSTMIRTGDTFFNTRNLQSQKQDKLKASLDFLFQQSATVQRGIKKAQIGGSVFDVRVIVINGRVEFTVFRQSNYPITNLHLGGFRGDWKLCRSAIPDRVWIDAMDDCVAAANLYETDIVGIDLMFDHGFMNHYIIELNPMGDFFPDWKNENGQSIHRVEIGSNYSRWLAGFGQAAG